jgi:hypothetical protein
MTTPAALGDAGVSKTMTDEVQDRCAQCHHPGRYHEVKIGCRMCNENRNALERFPERDRPQLPTYCPGFEEPE